MLVRIKGDLLGYINKVDVTQHVYTTHNLTMTTDNCSASKCISPNNIGVPVIRLRHTDNVIGKQYSPYDLTGVILDNASAHAP